MLGILSQSEIEKVLSNNLIGRIGCIDDQGIFIVPVTYVYRNGIVTCHSFEGRKLAAMRTNPDICFEIEAITDFKNWKCIIAQGRFEELVDVESIALARKELTEIALSKKASISALPPSENPATRIQGYQGASIFYRIHLVKITGRFEQSVVD